MGSSRFQDLGSCKILTGLSAEKEAGEKKKRKKGKATKRDPSATATTTTTKVKTKTKSEKTQKGRQNTYEK